jgi:hypothetical protein
VHSGSTSFTQPVSALQESCVQTLPSSQSIVLPAHVPVVQTSFSVHALPSSHDVEESCWQVPSEAAPAATLQAWQSVGSSPPHSVRQQTPSTQNPVAQSVSSLQEFPNGTYLIVAKSGKSPFDDLPVTTTPPSGVSASCLRPSILSVLFASGPS